MWSPKSPPRPPAKACRRRLLRALRAAGGTCEAPGKTLTLRLARPLRLPQGDDEGAGLGAELLTIGETIGEALPFILI